MPEWLGHSQPGMVHFFGVGFILASDLRFLLLLVLLMNSFIVKNNCENIINALSTEIYGTSFDHVRTCLISLNVHVGIFPAACRTLNLVILG